MDAEMPLISESLTASSEFSGVYSALGVLKDELPQSLLEHPAWDEKVVSELWTS